MHVGTVMPDTILIINQATFLGFFVTFTHIPVGLLWTGDQLVAEAATYTTHIKHKRRVSMPSATFEPAILGIERFQTYDLYRTASEIGDYELTF